MRQRQVELLKSLSLTITEFQKATASLEGALAHHAEGDAYAHAKHFRDDVLPAMKTLRTLGDKLETVVADDGDVQAQPHQFAPCRARRCPQHQVRG